MLVFGILLQLSVLQIQLSSPVTGACKIKNSKITQLFFCDCRSLRRLLQVQMHTMISSGIDYSMTLIYLSTDSFATHAVLHVLHFQITCVL